VDANVVASIIACGVGVVTCGVTTGLILWKGGGQAERVETSVRRIEGLEKKLEVLSMIPVIEARVGMLENVMTTMRSDFRELRGSVDDTRKMAIRAEMASQHDVGE
jgi:hypothetical protein